MRVGSLIVVFVAVALLADVSYGFFWHDLQQQEEKPHKQHQEEMVPPENVACGVAPSARVDCGWGGITADQCRQRGCCFNSAIVGTYWCFYKKGVCDVAPSDRKDCGWGGITKDQCRQRGCCFNDKVRGTIWCYHKKGAGKRSFEKKLEDFQNVAEQLEEDVEEVEEDAAFGLMMEGLQELREEVKEAEEDAALDQEEGLQEMREAENEAKEDATLDLVKEALQEGEDVNHELDGDAFEKKVAGFQGDQDAADEKKEEEEEAAGLDQVMERLKELEEKLQKGEQ